MTDLSKSNARINLYNSTSFQISTNTVGTMEWNTKWEITTMMIWERFKTRSIMSLATKKAS